MKNLLIAESAYHRLKNEIDLHKDKLRIYTLSAIGKIQLECEAVDADIETLDINLGWFSRDLIEDKTSQTFAVNMLKSPKLEWMQTLSAGVDHSFFKMLGGKGIRLCNSDAQAPAIAEYVLASVMHRYQGFDIRRQYQNAKEWKHNDFREICDSNWLIIGFGNIGSRIGKGVQALGGRVTGVKRSVAKVDGADQIITFQDIADSLPQQDVIVLSCALTDETRGIINHDFLNAIKPNAVLVNIGRGDLIDETALLGALNNDQLDYAILDVFETEPLPEASEFWRHEKVLMTPHSSNRGSGTNGRGDTLFLTNLSAYLNNTKLKNEVSMSDLVKD
ncbi:MAG: D-2-hydroxyacid dehydrogenase [Pseudomonadales bacterium]|nr:D-2-hydroxyacid dehydrogenase [Pseudomonadales bacterium]